MLRVWGVTGASVTDATVRNQRRIAFEGVGIQPGDGALWTPLEEPVTGLRRRLGPQHASAQQLSCGSLDAGKEHGGEQRLGTGNVAAFTFTTPGTYALCYRFRSGGTPSDSLVAFPEVTIVVADVAGYDDALVFDPTSGYGLGIVIAIPALLCLCAVLLALRHASRRRQRTDPSLLRPNLWSHLLRNPSSSTSLSSCACLCFRCASSRLA